jgi:hypothetical protein
LTLLSSSRWQRIVDHSPTDQQPQTSTSS